MHAKRILRFKLTPITMAKIQYFDNTTELINLMKLRVLFGSHMTSFRTCICLFVQWVSSWDKSLRFSPTSKRAVYLRTMQNTAKTAQPASPLLFLIILMIFLVDFFVSLCKSCMGHMWSFEVAPIVFLHKYIS